MPESEAVLDWTGDTEPKGHRNNEVLVDYWHPGAVSVRVREEGQGKGSVERMGESIWRHVAPPARLSSLLEVCLHGLALSLKRGVEEGSSLLEALTFISNSLF